MPSYLVILNPSKCTHLFDTATFEKYILNVGTVCLQLRTLTSIIPLSCMENVSKRSRRTFVELLMCIDMAEREK